MQSVGDLPDRQNIDCHLILAHMVKEGHFGHTHSEPCLAMRSDVLAVIARNIASRKILTYPPRGPFRDPRKVAKATGHRP